MNLGHPRIDSEHGRGSNRRTRIGPGSSGRSFPRRWDRPPNTGDFTPVPPTGLASAHRSTATDSGSRDGRETRSFVDTPQPDTAPFTPGDSTADAPAGTGDRGATASFQLDPAFDQGIPERTLPPSADDPGGPDLPWIAGYEILEVLGRAGWGSSTRRASPGSTVSSP